MTTRKQYTFRRWTVTFHLPDDTIPAMSEFQVAAATDPSTYTIVNQDVFNYLSPRFKFDSGKYASWVFQVESAPSTGILHIQGYISFKDAVSMTAVKKTLDMPGVHLEPAHSDAQTNFKYCTKKDTRVFGPWAYGNFGGPGHRSDLDALYALAEQHATGREMLQQLGSAGMKHLYLYQKTTRVLLEDDDVDKRILAARQARVSEAAANTRVRDVSDEDEESESESDSDEDEATGDFFNQKGGR